MFDLGDKPWWPSLVEALEHEPLEALLEPHGASLEAAEAVLAQMDDGGAITRSAAWPEIVRRIEDGGSLRDAARRFSTSPRRIRRGLARSGIRVGGVEVPSDGLPQLSPFVDQLGSTPDGEIAELAGVPVEAVQGERRRRGVSAFRPRPAPRRSPERHRPPPPKKVSRPKVWQREEAPAAVVRRAPRRALGADIAARATPSVGGFASGFGFPRPASPAPAPTEPTRRRTRRRIVRSEDADGGPGSAD